MNNNDKEYAFFCDTIFKPINAMNTAYILILKKEILTKEKETKGTNKQRTTNINQPKQKTKTKTKNNKNNTICGNNHHIFLQVTFVVF